MTDTITKTAQDEVLFISNRSSELWLVRQGAESRYNNVGTHIGDFGRKRYEFRDHQLRVRPGQDIMADGPIDPATNEPTEQDALTWLRNHPGFNGSDANAFHEHGKEVGRVPDPGPTFDQINALSIYGDEQAIEDLIEGERETWGRETVLERAQAALEQVREAKASLAPDDGA